MESEIKYPFAFNSLRWVQVISGLQSQWKWKKWKGEFPAPEVWSFATLFVCPLSCKVRNNLKDVFGVVWLDKALFITTEAWHCVSLQAPVTLIQPGQPPRQYALLTFNYSAAVSGVNIPACDWNTIMTHWRKIHLKIDRYQNKAKI